MVATFTGIAIGEILAARWNRVDLDRKVIECVRRWNDEGTRHPPQGTKSRAGRRDITLPDILVDVLREHASALELRMQIGADACPMTRCCSRTSKAGRCNEQRLVGLGEIAAASRAEITFHSLRHTHASQLIAPA